MQVPRLGINIDHVATLRNARGGVHPCPLRAAHVAHQAGADGITMHVREDRRHVNEYDLERVAREVSLPLNFEMAATPEMQALALRIQPHAVCLVPERREERTTEGGLNVTENIHELAVFIAPLKSAGCRVSLFIAPDDTQVLAAAKAGADIVELHTGPYAHAENMARELQRLQHAAALAHSHGLEVHAGHGLTFDNVQPIAAIPEIRELNIGHFIIGEALFLGLTESIHRMKSLITQARV